MTRQRPLRILCVASGGGHLEQMLACVDALGGHRIVIGLYRWRNLAGFEHPGVDHLRFVMCGGSGSIGVIGSLLAGVFQWAWIILTERPDVILSTGAELAIAPIVLGKVLFRRRTVFLETAARMEHPSGTGKVAYPFCDAFFVQSEAMLKHYGPKARYVGRLL